MFKVKRGKDGFLKNIIGTYEKKPNGGLLELFMGTFVFLASAYFLAHIIWWIIRD